jgi:class 3 adenylate cyclase
VWENPSFAEFLRKLSSFSRLILYDRLGNGLSDRGPTGHVFEDEIDDVRSVLAAVGSNRAALFGCHVGGRLALLLAAAAPREATDPTVRHWWSMFVHSAASSVELHDGIKSLGPVDIRQLLGSIHLPVLVLHRSGDRLADVRASRYMAERLPDAKLVELRGDDHLPFFGDQDTVVALTQEFLTGATPAADPDRVLATVLFTDIVDSTRRAAEQGDRRWRRVLDEHHQAVRRNLARFRGREVETTGDGFLATFDGPARAIRAAQAIHAEVGDLGLQVRAGLHTGECELLGADIGGIAVHTAARVLAQAGPGETWCSRTVKDLVAGAASASPTAAPTPSRASPTAGSSTPWSSPNPARPRPGPGNHAHGATSRAVAAARPSISGGTTPSSRSNPTRAGAATTTVTSGPPRPAATTTDRSRTPATPESPADPARYPATVARARSSTTRTSRPPLAYHAPTSTSPAAATAAPSARFASARCPRNQLEVSHPNASTISTSPTNPTSNTSACPASPAPLPAHPPAPSGRGRPAGPLRRLTGPRP